MIAFFNAFSAMVIYGAWAVYANFEHGQHAWVVAGVVQAIYAFISTLTVTIAASWMYKKCGRGWCGVFIGFSFSFLIMLAIPVMVHNFASTPDILETILPGLIWGSGYLSVFLVLTERQYKKSSLHVTKYHQSLN